MTVEKIIEKTQEKDLAVYFKDPIDKLNKLNKLELETRKEKKQIVMEIAQRLEADGVTPIHSICQIMVKHLEGVVSPTFVRRCLPSEYKNEQRSKNAKKQNKTPKEPVTNGKDLATQVPLNSSAQDSKKEEANVIGVTKNNISFPGDEADIESLSSSSPTKTRNISAVVDSPLFDSINPNVPIEEQLQQMEQKQQDQQDGIDEQANLRYTQCPQCIIKDRLYLKEKEQNNKLKQAIKKLPLSIRTNILLSASIDKEKIECNSLKDFELDVPWKEIDKCLPSSILIDADARLRICMKIDILTGKVNLANLEMLDPEKGV